MPLPGFFLLRREQHLKSFPWGKLAAARNEPLTDEGKSLSRFRLRSTTLPKGEGFSRLPLMRELSAGQAD